jgi:hypothetical protein
MVMTRHNGINEIQTSFSTVDEANTRIEIIEGEMYDCNTGSRAYR